MGDTDLRFTAHAETLDRISAEAARNFGTRTALVFCGRRFSFEEIDQLVERFAVGLAAQGVSPGDVVTLYASNSWEWVVSYYAVFRLGAVLNPINVMLTPPEVEYVVNDCGAKVIIASPEKGLPILSILARTNVQTVILFGDDTPENIVSFNALLESTGSLPEIASPDPEGLSTICYTSGTTGRPKGVMQTHRAVVSNALMTAKMHARTVQDVTVSALPCPHVYANVVMNGVFLCGMTLVLHERFNAEDILASIQETRATMFEGVPTMYMYMLNSPALAKTELGTLSRCTVGGQTMPEAIMQEVQSAFGCPLIELWGMTEMAGLGATHPVGGAPRIGSIGVALPMAELRIADPEDVSRTLDTGEIGELVARGPLVTMGYYNDPERTRAALTGDGWLKTGDLARMDEDGYFWIVDRLNDMILTGGFNIYPAEIERVLAMHPDVAMSAVGRVEDPVKGETARAYIVLKQRTNASEQDITSFCKPHLAAYKIPRSIRFVEDMPKTSTGKIMRRELHRLD